MKKIGLLFPGQGSQYVGMGKELYAAYPEAKQVYNEANTLLGYDLTKIIFEGPEDELRQTRYTQLAIFVTSLACFKVFTKSYSIDTKHCIGAGHSLGEYSALAAASVFSIHEGLQLVQARGKFIQHASEKNPGTMAAILGIEREALSNICRNVSESGTCELVNFNSPGQIVISGSTASVNKACELAKESGAMKTVVLNVSGPFHSTLMNEASQMMQQELNKFDFNTPAFAVVANYDAQLMQDNISIKEKLVKQINNPVLWQETITYMIAQGVDVFVEIGPQKVLSGLLRRIDKTKKALNVEDVKSLEKTLESIQGVA